MNYSWCFNSYYIEFDDYQTREKLIWTSGGDCINKNTIRKRGTPKSNINNISPSSTFGFGCYSNKDTYDILSEYLISCILHAYSLKTRGMYWGI